jgi:hypothetical protein
MGEYHYYFYQFTKIINVYFNFIYSEPNSKRSKGFRIRGSVIVIAACSVKSGSVRDLQINKIYICMYKRIIV